MRVGIVGDTHGFHDSWLRAYELYLRDVDLILHTGDILYCSPGFNPLTPEFDPGRLADHLNALPVPILFCRGDCDSDVDQKKLSYPIQSEFNHVYIDGLSILMHHGENPELNTNFRSRLTPDEMERYARKMKASVMVMGRTHRPVLEDRSGLLHVNPGSPVATVHDNTTPSVAILDTAARVARIHAVTVPGQVLAEIGF